MRDGVNASVGAAFGVRMSKAWHHNVTETEDLANLSIEIGSMVGSKRQGD